MKLLKWIVSFFLVVAVAKADSNDPSANHIWERAAYGNVTAFAGVSLSGYNGAITTTFEPFWPETAAYVVLATAMSSPYCASSDANDTSAGTGARTIQVTGITSAFAAFSETVTMNGQTSVTLSNTTAQLINSVTVLTAGSGGVNAGVIRCGTGANTNGVPAVTHAHVAAGDNRAHSFIYGVPDNYTLLCRNFTVSSYGVTAAQTIQTAIDTYTNNGVRIRRYLPALNQAGASVATYSGTIAFPEKTILVGQALSAASTGPVYLQAECVLIGSDWLDTNEDLF